MPAELVLILAEWTTMLEVLVLAAVDVVWIPAELVLTLAEWTVIVEALVLAAAEMV